jgi:ankyrin repeat protein
MGTNGLGVTINLAGRKGWTEIVRKHIARDPLAVHQRGWIGDSPLHWPAHNDNVAIVTMLLDAGADIEAHEINCYGGKPLHWASEHAPHTVRLLLERGADVNSRNQRAESEFHGMTPLIMNATQRDDCAEVAELLLAAGADVNAPRHRACPTPRASPADRCSSDWCRLPPRDPPAAGTRRVALWRRRIAGA